MFSCRHQLQESGSVFVVACAECGLVQFWDDAGPMPAEAGMAALFGAFTMQGSLSALGAPGPEAFLYAPPTKAARRFLGAFPTGVWLETQPGLWMSHDGEHLLLAPSDPLISHNLGRGA